MRFYVQFDIAALFVLGLLFLHYFPRRQVRNFKSRLFLSFIIVVFASAVFDIIGVWTIDNTADIPLSLAYMVNSIYLALQFLTPALLFAYLFTSMADADKAQFKYYPLLCIPAVIGCLICLFLNYSTHWVFFFDEGLVYTYGPLHYLMFVSAAYYILAGLLGTVWYYPLIRKVRARALVIIVVVSALIVLIQPFIPAYIISNFGMSLVVLTMYLTIQSPEEELDPLTAMPTSQSFYARLEYLLKRNKEDFILVYCNIKRFKVFNDLFGSKAGDELLVALARILKARSDVAAVCGRLAGDHFILCLPATGFDPDEVLAAIQRQLDIAFPDYGVRLSFGVYPITDKAIPANLMCDRAHLALQTIATSEAERYAVYDASLRTSMVEQHGIVKEMGPALECGQFKVYLQPIVDLRSRELISAEALVRWVHPQKGIVPPKMFIELFENNGLIMKLDYHIWESVCKMLARWKDEGKFVLPLSVNISRADLFNPHLAEDIVELTGRYGIDSSQIKFEITESSYLADTGMLLHLVEVLQGKGFAILLDDFGSGYSSLSVLKDTPFDQLKIDMRFLAGADTQRRGAAIISSVIRMAKELGLFTVAEGVETEEQAERLVRMGCDAAQGYFFAHPMSIEDFEERYLNTSSVDA